MKVARRKPTRTEEMRRVVFLGTTQAARPVCVRPLLPNVANISGGQEAAIGLRRAAANDRLAALCSPERASIRTIEQSFAYFSVVSDKPSKLKIGRSRIHLAVTRRHGKIFVE